MLFRSRGELVFGGNPHSCGEPSVHNPDVTYGTMTDQEGNTYKTVVIGTQEWMAENLNTATYRNGDSILYDLDTLDIGAYGVYTYDPSFECPYGKIYNWYAVTDDRHVCPVGWHEPTSEEWATLINFVDPNADGGLAYPNVAAGPLKSVGSLEFGTGHFLYPNAGATNSTGF